MSTALNSLKDLLWTGLCLVGFGLLLWNLPALVGASQTLLQKAGSVTAIEVEGVKVAFDQQNISSRLDPFGVDAAKKAKVFDAVSGLEPEEFERLLNVGELGETCEFQRPTADMLRMLTADYQLKEKGLTSIADAPELKARIKAQTKVDEETSGKPSDIGYPHKCYVMDLTDTGRDVRTALIKIIGGTFAQHVALK